MFVVKMALALPLGILAGCGAVYVFNRLPAEWLCDYGEVPREEKTQRISGVPWKGIFSAGFACLWVHLCATMSVQYSIAALIVCWLLLMVAISDRKYMIIPDQFVCFIAACTIGLAPILGSYPQEIPQGLAPWGMLWKTFAMTDGQIIVANQLGGAIVGGGIMLIVALVAKGISGREAMGFGDVKLMAAIGLATGIGGALFTLILSSLSAGVAAAIGLATKKVKPTDEKPLGPHICGAAITYLFIVVPLMV